MSPAARRRRRSVRFVFITGLSGSGKSAAMKALEDAGYFCVDNLPPRLVGPFAELAVGAREGLDRVALVVDIRERGFLKDFPGALAALRDRGVATTLVFLEAREEILVRRFSETRRPHPLAVGRGSVLEAVRAERRQLAAIHKLADDVIDTSGMTVHELRRFFMDRYGEAGRSRKLAMNVLSFGYKYGVPTEADLVFDVRFLPNPYFERKLRAKHGGDRAVVRFLRSFPVTAEFLERLEGFVDYLIPQFVAEGKSYVTIAIGCTGGRHRSVMIADELGRHLAGGDYAVRVTHRDVDKES